ncbi:hypothetical protein [Moraxella marmotae]|uniref:hypothetical protein n=1 Tax=Moraxella marmotae TaxID=3344520 RepID=UPI0035F3E735
MKNFIKIAPLALALIIAPNAHANNNQKIAFVKKMYAEQKQKQGQHFTVAIQKYGTTEFKQALRYANNMAKILDGACYDADPFFSSSDPDYNAKISYSVNAQGNVVAHIASRMHHSHSQSTFVLVKSGKGYKLADIYAGGASFKQELVSC